MPGYGIITPDGKIGGNSYNDRYILVNLISTQDGYSI